MRSLMLRKKRIRLFIILTVALGIPVAALLAIFLFINSSAMVSILEEKWAEHGVGQLEIGSIELDGLATATIDDVDLLFARTGATPQQVLHINQITAEGEISTLSLESLVIDGWSIEVNTTLQEFVEQLQEQFFNRVAEKSSTDVLDRIELRNGVISGADYQLSNVALVLTRENDFLPEQLMLQGDADDRPVVLSVKKDGEHIRINWESGALPLLAMHVQAQALYPVLVPPTPVQVAEWVPQHNIDFGGTELVWNIEQQQLKGRFVADWKDGGVNILLTHTPSSFTCQFQRLEHVRFPEQVRIAENIVYIGDELPIVGGSVSGTYTEDMALSSVTVQATIEEETFALEAQKKNDELTIGWKKGRLPVQTLLRSIDKRITAMPAFLLDVLEPEPIDCAGTYFTWQPVTQNWSAAVTLAASWIDCAIQAQGTTEQAQCRIQTIRHASLPQGMGFTDYAMHLGPAVLQDMRIDLAQTEAGPVATIHAQGSKPDAEAIELVCSYTHKEVQIQQNSGELPAQDFWAAVVQAGVMRGREEAYVRAMTGGVFFHDTQTTISFEPELYIRSDIQARLGKGSLSTVLIWDKGALDITNVDAHIDAIGTVSRARVYLTFEERVKMAITAEDILMEDGFRSWLVKEDYIPLTLDTEAALQVVPNGRCNITFGLEHEPALTSFELWIVGDEQHQDSKVYVGVTPDKPIIITGGGIPLYHAEAWSAEYDITCSAGTAAAFEIIIDDEANTLKHITGTIRDGSFRYENIYGGDHIDADLFIAPDPASAEAWIVHVSLTDGSEIDYRWDDVHMHVLVATEAVETIVERAVCPFPLVPLSGALDTLVHFTYNGDGGIRGHLERCITDEFRVADYVYNLGMKVDGVLNITVENIIDWELSGHIHDGIIVMPDAQVDIGGLSPQVRMECQVDDRSLRIHKLHLLQAAKDGKEIDEGITASLTGTYIFDCPEYAREEEARSDAKMIVDNIDMAWMKENLPFMNIPDDIELGGKIAVILDLIFGKERILQVSGHFIPLGMNVHVPQIEATVTGLRGVLPWTVESQIQESEEASMKPEQQSSVEKNKQEAAVEAAVE